MKQVAYFLLGAFLLLCALTIAGSTGFIGLALLYSLCLYLLFFTNGSRGAYSFMIGVSAAFELLGTNHFGSATCFGLVIWLLYELLAARARFTSLYARFIVAVLSLYAIYAFYFFPLAGGAYRLLLLALTALPVALISLYVSSANQKAEYELL